MYAYTYAHIVCVCVYIYMFVCTYLTAQRASFCFATNALEADPPRRGPRDRGRPRGGEQPCRQARSHGTC